MVVKALLIFIPPLLLLVNELIPPLLLLIHELLPPLLLLVEQPQKMLLVPLILSPT
jgi:hypothetical protein